MRISDWSSDVCSSDLSKRRDETKRREGTKRGIETKREGSDEEKKDRKVWLWIEERRGEEVRRDERECKQKRRMVEVERIRRRSEERRVGKEWVRTGRSGWSGEQ